MIEIWLKNWEFFFHSFNFCLNYFELGQMDAFILCSSGELIYSAFFSHYLKWYSNFTINSFYEACRRYSTIYKCKLSGDDLIILGPTLFKINKKLYKYGSKRSFFSLLVFFFNQKKNINKNTIMFRKLLLYNTRKEKLEVILLRITTLVK